MFGLFGKKKKWLSKIKKEDYQNKKIAWETKQKSAEDAA